MYYSNKRGKTMPKDIHIAICDDEEHERNTLYKINENYALNKRKSVIISTYPTTDLLFKNIKEGNNYDILFLDLLFNNQSSMDGINLGTRIRCELHNRMMDIVVITNSKDYVEEVFYIDTKRFIQKPIKEKKVIEALDSIFDFYENRTKSFYEYRIGGYPYRVDIADIICLWVDKRMVHIETVLKEDFFYDRIGNVLKILQPFGFVMANRSYIINLLYVSEFTTTHITLKTGKVIPLSKSCYKELNRLYKNAEDQHNVSTFYNLNITK